MAHRSSLTADAVLAELRSLANPSNVAGMARFGITSTNTLGIGHTVLKQIARRYKGDHELALGLWESGIHEARILAPLVDDPKLVTRQQAEAWVADLDSWDVCD